MIFREPVIADYQFIFECYQDWPLGDLGPVTLDKAIGFVRYWIAHVDEICRIAVETAGAPPIEQPVGFIKYRRNPLFIDNLVVHPAHRGNGFSTEITKLLQAELAAEGETEALFEALPGLVADQVGVKFEKVEERTGKRTGLPVMVGRVFADTQL